MKKIILFILCISSFFALSICAEAKTTYTPSELVNYWEANGYPDYVGGVYYKDDLASFVVVLVDATPEEKKNLIDSINYRKVETVEGKYSHNRLYEIQEELVSVMESDKDNIQSSAVDDINNCIIVSVEKESLQKYTDYFESLYDDAVVVEEATGITMNTVLDHNKIAGSLVGELGDIGGTAPTVKNTDFYYYLFVAILTAVLFATIARLRRLSTKAYSTADGTVVTHNTDISRKEIIRQIENSAVAPKDELLTEIKQKISADS